MKLEIKKILWSELSSRQASTRTSAFFTASLNLWVQSGHENGTVRLPDTLAVASSLNWAHIIERSLEAPAVMIKVSAFVAPSFFAEEQRHEKSLHPVDWISLEKELVNLSLGQFPCLCLPR